MKLSGRDWFALVAVIVVIGVLALGTRKGKGKQVPLDDRHQASYDALKAGKDKAEVELVCTTCHSKSSLPLPKGHPPKEQCLICHGLLPS